MVQKKKNKNYTKQLKRWIDNNSEISCIENLSYDTSSYISYLPKDMRDYIKEYLLNISLVLYITHDIWCFILYNILINDCIIKYTNIHNKTTYINAKFKGILLKETYYCGKITGIEYNLLIVDRYTHKRKILISIGKCKYFNIYIYNKYNYIRRFFYGMLLLLHFIYI